MISAYICRILNKLGEDCSNIYLIFYGVQIGIPRVC